MKKGLFVGLLSFVLCLSLLSTGAWAEALPEEDSAWLALQQAVQSGGIVTLTGDVVCDDQAYGPIVVPEGVSVTLDLNGHTIDRNLTEAVDRGAVLDVYGSLTVKDGSSAGTGTITGGNNTASVDRMVAGGIQVSGGSLVLESGNITGCLSDERGSGVAIEGGSFTMNGGSISGNRSISHGAGVNITSGTFTMKGGIISGKVLLFPPMPLRVIGGSPDSISLPRLVRLPGAGTDPSICREEAETEARVVESRGSTPLSQARL